MGTFYRVHWADCPEFCAANAWSAPWGVERSEDGSRTLCSWCGNGQYGTDPADCSTCGGDGWEDAERGYSCTFTADELAAYLAERGEPATGDVVIVFEGEQVGNGTDGEPLAIPTHVLQTVSWADFLKEN